MGLGIDIYRYQTVTDPAKVKQAGVTFAWVKLTDGNGYAMVRGDRQVGQMRSVKIPVGGYHFSQPGDPERQADLLVREARRLGAIQIPLMLDLEDNPAGSKLPNIPFGQKKVWAVKFCRRVQSSAFRPAIYMSGYDAKSLRPDQWGIPGLVIVIASYGPNNGKRNTLTGGYTGRVDVHQYTSKGRIPGISGEVDLDWSAIQLGASPVPVRPLPKEDDDLTPDDRRMLRELHTMLRPGTVKVQTPGVLTRELAEILVNGRQAKGTLAGLQSAITQLANTGKVDLAAVTEAARQGAVAGSQQAIDEALAQLEASAAKEASA